MDDRAAVQPGQHEQHGDGGTHGDHTHELVGTARKIA
jgi:hypothetical protein